MVGNWRKQPQPQQMEGTCQAQGVGWAGETSPLAFCRPRLLCRSTSAHKRGWASLMLTEPGNGWTERTMRPTSSKRALAARALLPPGALAPAGSGSQPLIPGVPPPPPPRGALRPSQRVVVLFPQELEARPAGQLGWARAGRGRGLRALRSR